MTDGIPPDRRCPIWGALNVNPHPHSLCPDHYPGDPYDVARADRWLDRAALLIGDPEGAREH